MTEKNESSDEEDSSLILYSTIYNDLADRELPQINKISDARTEEQFKIPSYLSLEQTLKLKTLLNKYQDIFILKDPISSYVRRYSPLEKD
ncbi:hypothetical protein BB559_002005 [Furculomyces boomerangus]|uniref:Uncharacterized protein n=1 Tax=Furculomyces boomerangus TaxID=61424 RepID=A0A2T9YYZ0_9FUNG|nr:hypothetical protein BB559_002005 [Furculomyces boomerangus]